MALKLYNTLTRQKAEFVPIDPNNVRMYVCGPTVYDYAHIGNARPVIVFDVLFRLLRHIYGADHVTYVRNITDVDDKINARAARDYPDLPLNDAIRKVTEATEKQFHEDIAALGVLPPTYEPRATEYIRRKDGREDMVTLIDELVKNGHAYVAENHVLFDVASMPDYGRLSNRSLDEMEAGARVEVAPYKKGPMDFVLWKPSKPGEPAWPSPAGITVPGRPGWHIECSAMAGALLGPVFDIHGGGIDLTFPHHENEIAQSRCAHNTSVMANVWMHNGFLQVEGEKMSKSLGNFVTINELLRTDKFGGRRWPGAVVKLAMIKNNYRQPIDWTIKALEDAAEEVAEWSARLDDPSVKMVFDNAKTSSIDISPYGEVIEALGDDLNTADALAHIRSVVRKITREDAEARARLLANLNFMGLINPDLLPAYRLGVTSVDISPHDAKQYEHAVIDIRTSIANNDIHAVSSIIEPYRSQPIKFEYKTETGAVFVRGTDTNINGKVELLVAARLEARKRKDFAESDRIRDELAQMGITLKDSKNKETGEIETTWEVAR